MIDALRITVGTVSLVPRFFVLQFACSIIHGSRRAVKTGKAWEYLSCDVDARWT